MEGKLTQFDGVPRLYEDAKNLWEICFPEDDRNFIEYYFKFRTAPEYVFCRVESAMRRAVATAHAIPKRVMCMGKEYSVLFITGVATHPDYRGRGIAGGLLRKIIAENEKKADALILQPASKSLYDYYARFGFTPMCEYSLVKIDSNRTAHAGESIPSFEYCKKAYDRLSEKFSGAFLRSDDDFRALLEEYTTCGGFVHTISDGYAAGYVTDGVLAVMEFAGSLSPENIDSIFSVCDCRAMELIVPTSMAGEYPYEAMPFNMILPLSDRARALDFPMTDFLTFERY